MFIVLFIAFHMLEMDRTEDFQGFKRQELCEFSGVCVLAQCLSWKVDTVRESLLQFGIGWWLETYTRT